MNIPKNITKKIITLWNILGITIILFILVNVILWLVIIVKDAPSTNHKKLTATSYNIDGKNDHKINLLLRESWDKQFIYEPYTQFKESPLNNLYSQVTQHGFRSIKNQGPWPINPNNINIFVFGGSTTFGYGTTNYQSIPSYLQEQLRNQAENVSVYNFGRSYYYSTQERILYESLINSENIPDIVIFIDGLNDFFNYQDIPAMTKQLNYHNNTFDYFVEEMISKLPIIRAYNFASRHTTNTLGKSPLEKEMNVDVQVPIILNTYLNNKRMINAISEEYNVKPFFVWQPVPFFNTDRNLDEFNGWLSYAIKGYNLMNKKRLNKELDDNFIWLSDLDSDREAYIDLVHYSPEFSARIAESISSFIFPYFDEIVNQQKLE